MYIYSAVLLFAVSVQCPAHDVRFDSTGVILSPGYPDSYPNLQMCSWSINVEKGYNITLHFEFFQTEKEYDILEVFDGSSLKTLIASTLLTIMTFVSLYYIILHNCSSSFFVFKVFICILLKLSLW